MHILSMLTDSVQAYTKYFNEKKIERNMPDAGIVLRSALIFARPGDKTEQSSVPWPHNVYIENGTCQGSYIFMLVVSNIRHSMLASVVV